MLFIASRPIWRFRFALVSKRSARTRSSIASTFSEFAEAWQQDRTSNKYDHAIERDYMEWEGLTAEKQRWLERLRGLPQRETVEVMMA